METMQETFRCDRCGREFPRNRLKEVFEDGDTRLELCPECLDARMNEAGVVRGGDGSEKARAAYVDEAADQAEYGRRD